MQHGGDSPDSADGLARPLAPAGSDRLPVPPDTFYVRRGKRLFDLAAGSAVLALTLPVQAVVAVLVRRKLGTPVLFRQVRPGLDEQPFEMVKFRTMIDATGSDGKPLPDDERLTPFGQFLRSTSLDELPELINVVRGELSLVGPRPLLMRYLPLYSPRQRRRHAVRPGVTGLAQVSGRNALTWEDKFELDVQYVEQVSFSLDLRILIRTVVNVLRRADVSAEGHVTMPGFDEHLAAQAAASRRLAG